RRNGKSDQASPSRAGSMREWPIGRSARKPTKASAGTASTPGERTAARSWRVPEAPHADASASCLPRCVIGSAGAELVPGVEGQGEVALAEIAFRDIVVVVERPVVLRRLARERHVLGLLGGELGEDE